MKILPPLEEEDTMIAALSYPFWFIVSWLILLSHKKKDPFVRFHAIQSLIFGIIISLVNIFLMLLLWIVFQWVPSVKRLLHGEVWRDYMWKGFFFVIIFSLFCLIFLAVLLVVLYYALRAYKGVYFKIPLIGGIIEKRYFSFLMDQEENEASREENTNSLIGRNLPDGDF